MLFRGIMEDDVGQWKDARARVADVNWANVVGVREEARDTGLFRVLEWGGMEVL